MALSVFALISSTFTVLPSIPCTRPSLTSPVITAIIHSPSALSRASSSVVSWMLGECAISCIRCLQTPCCEVRCSSSLCFSVLLPPRVVCGFSLPSSPDSDCDASSELLSSSLSTLHHLSWCRHSSPLYPTVYPWSFPTSIVYLYCAALGSPLLLCLYILLSTRPSTHPSSVSMHI